MNRVLCVLLLTALVVACGSKRESKPESKLEITAPDLDIAPDDAVKVDRAGATDPVVAVTQPSTVFVIQGGRVRFAIEWRHQKSGRITVPLRSIDDGSGPLYIGMSLEPILNVLPCPPCSVRSPRRDVPAERCCP